MKELDSCHPLHSKIFLSSFKHTQKHTIHTHLKTCSASSTTETWIIARGFCFLFGPNHSSIREGLRLGNRLNHSSTFPVWSLLFSVLKKPKVEEWSVMKLLQSYSRARKQKEMAPLLSDSGWNITEHTAPCFRWAF